MEKFIPIPPPPPPKTGFTVSSNSVFRQFKDEVKEELKEEMKSSIEIDNKEITNNDKNEKKIGKLNIPLDLKNKINSVYANRSNTKNNQENTKSNEIKPIINENKQNINVNKSNVCNENTKKEVIFENITNTNLNDYLKQDNNNISSINNRLVLEMTDNTINKIFEYTDKLMNKENNNDLKKEVKEELKKEIEVKNIEFKEIKNNIIKNKSEFIILSAGFIFGYVVNYYVEHYDVFKLF
jgi:hypothetical protein